MPAMAIIATRHRRKSATKSPVRAILMRALHNVNHI
jgi:hypothetical protein